MNAAQAATRSVQESSPAATNAFHSPGFAMTMSIVTMAAMRKSVLLLPQQQPLQLPQQPLQSPQQQLPVLLQLLQEFQLPHQ
jgi:hypothetical protein